VDVNNTMLRTETLINQLEFSLRKGSQPDLPHIDRQETAIECIRYMISGS